MQCVVVIDVIIAINIQTYETKIVTIQITKSIYIFTDRYDIGRFLYFFFTESIVISDFGGYFIYGTYIKVGCNRGHPSLGWAHLIDYSIIQAYTIKRFET